jgi:tectonin beta-propeller repeat-containing protein 1
LFCTNFARFIVNDFFNFIIKVIIEPKSMFWRQMGGHLKKVEACNSSVTWGIGYDNTAWVYTGGWGGMFLKGK